MKWGIDLICPLPAAPEWFKYTVVTVDYFTKWLEAKPLKKITAEQLTSFVKNTIVYRLGIP